VDGGGSVKLAYKCTECGAPSYTPATTAVLDHPAVVSLLHDAGIDYRVVSSWEIQQALDSEECISQEDPVRVDVTVNTEDGELTLTLDEDLNVVEYG
jgi:hypothetical protein